MRIDEAGRHHHVEDRHGAEADRHHDAERQEQAQEGVEAEPVFAEREGRHGAEQQHGRDRADGDDEAVQEVVEEHALAQTVL